MALPDIGGFVLAGGKSSRMGRDKALLKLAGKPLVFYAVTKLRHVCADVHILSSRTELEVFAPLLRDLHEGCGPMGGIEVALESSPHEWNLFIPVDMPFLPSAFLASWVQEVVGSQRQGARVAMFTVGGVPQPLFCLLHREVAGFVREAMLRGEYKVFPVLKEAAMELAMRQGVGERDAFLNTVWDEREAAIEPRGDKVEAWREFTGAQEKSRWLWFANLNTPEEFDEAEKHLDALDT